MSSLIPPLALLCIASLALPNRGAAQSLISVPVVEGTTTVTGTVRWAGVSGVTVDTDGGQRLMFELDRTSRVASTLRVGEAVRVTYHNRSTGRHAARITPLHLARAGRRTTGDFPDRVRSVPVAFAMASSGRQAPAESAAEPIAQVVTDDLAPLATVVTRTADEPPPSGDSAGPGLETLLALMGGLTLGVGIGLALSGSRHG